MPIQKVTKKGKQMVNERHKKESNEQWCASLVKCDLCAKQWVAVYILETDRLECPRCHNMATSEVLEIDNT